MKYVSVAQIAKAWAMSERGVRNYCSQNKIEGAFLKGKTWNIPENARKPERITKQTEPSSNLSSILREEKKRKRHGGIYHKIQVDLTFNSNHMEGSKLSHDQTRYIYETNTISLEGLTINVDDIVETANHFRCIDLMIDRSNFTLGKPFIKQLHAWLKSGTSDSRKDWFEVGEYKKLPNEMGGHETTLPENVEKEIRLLLSAYNAIEKKTLDDIIDFHVRFERIHPFQDGNGRVGRLIMFKECLRWNIVPFIISTELKMFYYRGLNDWHRERGFLRDTCLSAQDTFKHSLDYFKIPYEG